MTECKNQLEKLDQECKDSINRNWEDLQEEIRKCNNVLKEELMQNLKEKIAVELGVELQRGLTILKQDLKDYISGKVGIELQHDISSLKQEVRSDLKQNLDVITQDLNKKHNELLNLIKGPNPQQQPNLNQVGRAHLTHHHHHRPRTIHCQIHNQ